MHAVLVNSRVLLMVAIWEIINSSWNGIASAEELHRRGYFGGVMIDVPPGKGQGTSGTLRRPGGLVKNIYPDSPAEKAGIKPNDIILNINGKPLSRAVDFGEVMRGARVKDRLKMSILREGQLSKKEVIIQPFPLEKGPTHEVLYQTITVNGYKLRTIITKPKRKPPFPAVFFIQGIDCSSVDFGVNTDHPYKKLLDAFIAKGFVTMRVDKTGVGDSEGPACREVDFKLETASFKTGLDSLMKLEFVDKKNVFLFGHSMGGIIAPIIAEKTAVKGITVFGTCTKTWLEYDLENTRRQLELQDIEPKFVQEEIKAKTQLLYLLLVNKQSPSAMIKSYPHLKKYFSENKYLFNRHYSYFPQLYDINLAEKWMNNRAFVLALWGKADFASGPQDHQLIVNMVNGKQPGRGTYLPLENIDHGFHAVSSMKKSYQHKYEKNFNSKIIEVTLKWMKQIIKK